MMWDRREIIGAGAAALAATSLPRAVLAQESLEAVEIDLGRETGALTMSGHAVQDPIAHRLRFARRGGMIWRGSVRKPGWSGCDSMASSMTIWASGQAA